MSVTVIFLLFAFHCEIAFIRRPRLSYQQPNEFLIDKRFYVETPFFS